MCYKTGHVLLTDAEFSAYMKHYFHGDLIQNCLPDMDPAVREFIRLPNDGYCHDCMELLFGRTSDRIREGAESSLDKYGISDNEVETLEDLANLENEAQTLLDSLADKENVNVSYGLFNSEEAGLNIVGRSENFVAYHH